MVQDTLLTLIQSAKSVFHPSSAESLKNFEKYVYENRVDILTQPDGNLQVRFQKKVAVDEMESTDFSMFSEELLKASAENLADPEDNDDDDTTSYSSIE